MEKRENFIKKNWKQIILFFAITLVIVCLAFYFFNLFNFLFSNSQTSECHEIYGYFGSYVGGVLGTIIGFVTLFFVYITYTSQRKELKLQSELIAQQQFESTFFNMLNVHRELKKDLKYSKSYYGTNPFERFGLDVIKYVNDKYKTEFSTVSNTYNGEENLYSGNLEIKKSIEENKNDEFSLELSKIHF